MATPSHGDVKAFAVKAVEDINKQLGRTDDLAAESMFAPDFSKGTSALDDSGKPIVAQDVVAPPEGDAAGSVDGLAEAKAEISGEPAPAAPARERDPSTGRFKSEAADSAEQPAAVQAQAAPSAEVAAEAAAEAILERPDPMADYEEVEYQDPDLDKTFKVRVHKDDANAVKRGYMRQADYTRKTMGLAAVRKDLQPLIDSGQITQLLPLIQRALSDPEYGNFVVDAYQRRMQGLSLTPAQAQAAQAVQAVTEQAAPPPVLSENEDPFMAQVLAPFKERIDKAVTLAERLAAEQDARVASERAAQQQSAHRANIAYQAHQELWRRFPDAFNGDINHDNAEFTRAINYARDSGYLQSYGENPLAVVLAYEDLRNSRAEAAASPAAAAIEQAQARQVAAVNAGSVAPGGPKTNTVKKVVPPVPQTRVNGIPVDIKEYANQQRARLAASQQ